ncbi:RnfABCDGE type electron transport complex subunit B [Symbiobacterium terraclitae]|uniref:RnfABCDGE type electron transport complex subunit B n=1 Tax=Symbiobacterium terraclitae TaxID=557451 RepID=UPI0035B56424
MMTAALVLGGAGLVLGAGLAFVAVKIAVPPDERVAAVRERLPGANCGACGFPGCDGLAAALVKGEAKPDSCTAGGPATAAAVAEVLGLEAVAGERMVVAVHCVGTNQAARRSYEYLGIADCRAAAIMPGGGPRACSYGCVGLGTCVRACPFDALAMDDEAGLPVVDREKCTGCGICTQECPKNIMALVPASQPTLVCCRNLDKGPQVRKACSAGCIACGLCVRSCPQKTISLVNNVACIDPAGCDGCGTCVEKCPTKCIVFTHNVPIVQAV